MVGDLTGHVLDGRYRVVAQVGKGAMGSVYRGEHLKLGRVVAIKVINDHASGAMASRERFEREALAMARLEHPNCATVLDVGMYADMPFVVMDFVAGTNLKEVLASGPLPPDRAIDITRQVLAGLSCAHEHGIIHRDIKPANIVLSQKSGLGDHVKILDFGLAKFSQQASNLTSGLVVGTPAYMAPEQILGRPIDPRTDLYACGVLLFELLTGRTPFQPADNQPLSMCMMHLNVDPPALREAAAGADFGALEDVVARALAKDPEQRFASAAAFADALAAARGHVRAPTSEPAAVASAAMTIPVASATAPRRGRRVAAGLGASGAVVAIVIAATRLSSRDAPPKPATAAAAASGSASAIDAAAPAPPSLATPTPPPLATPAPAAPAAPAAPDPVAELIARTGTPSSSRGRQHAIAVLLDARKKYPKDARLPYHAGLLYMDQMWWPDGLKQLHAAIALDPALKADPTLIKAVIRGFDTTASYDWTLASFLRKDIGAAAKPYLEDVAQHHPNAVVRKRAAAELRHY